MIPPLGVLFKASQTTGCTKYTLIFNLKSRSERSEELSEGKPLRMGSLFDIHPGNPRWIPQFNFAIVFLFARGVRVPAGELIFALHTRGDRVDCFLLDCAVSLKLAIGRNELTVIAILRAGILRRRLAVVVPVATDSLVPAKF